MFILGAAQHNCYLASVAYRQVFLGSALPTLFPCPPQPRAADTYLILPVLTLPNNESSSALQSVFKKSKLSSTVSTIKLSIDECLWWSVFSCWWNRRKNTVICSYQAIFHEFFTAFQIPLNNKSVCFSDFILNTSGKLALGTALWSQNNVAN